MKIAPIITRIHDQCPALARVRGAAELAAALHSGALGDDAWVILTDIAPGAQRLVNAHSQRVVIRFAVVLHARHAADSLGGAALEILDAPRRAVLDALVAWAPGEEFDPIDYAGGRLAMLLDAGLLWADEFTTIYDERRLPP